MRTVKAIYRASYTDYDGLATYRVMPTNNVPIDALEPFIFLNHHGPQVYAPNNAGLPFGPHPHKGFETVTFILSGDIVHKDSSGFSSTIQAGGIQWMTAGRGIIHSENSSEEFIQHGGPLEILQLWVNLPARLKNAPPHYIGLHKEQIPIVTLDDDKAHIHLVSGIWEQQQAPVQSLSNVSLSWVDIKKSGHYPVRIPKDNTVLFYVIKGNVIVNGEAAENFELVEFGNDAEDITIQATEDSTILLGYARPNAEPIVAHGPFVMNTQEEIRQAFVDYQQGKLGISKD